MKGVFFISIIFMLSCSDKIKIEDVKSIKLIIDPNHLTNSSEIKIIENKDSITNLIKCLNNREIEIWKFLPKYKIEINYTGKTIRFTGNNNHVMDEKGKTYKLLEKESELYSY